MVLWLRIAELDRTWTASEQSGRLSKAEVRRSGAKVPGCGPADQWWWPIQKKYLNMSGGITDDWSIRGWILAMGGAQCAMLPLEITSRLLYLFIFAFWSCLQILISQFPNSWTFMTVEKYANLPSVPLLMGLSIFLIIAGGFANNFLSAYIHGMLR